MMPLINTALTKAFPSCCNASAANPLAGPLLATASLKGVMMRTPQEGTAA